MKRLWAFVSVAILLTGIFGVFDTQKALAAVSNEEISQMIAARNTYFDPIDKEKMGPLDFSEGSFGDAYERMVRSVASRLKDDPDINKHQLRKYVLEGIPGATDPDQTGFIPLLNRTIASTATSEANRARARIMLPQAQQLLSNSSTLDQREGGVLTTAEADAQMVNAAQTGSASTAAALNENSVKPGECSLNPLKFSLTNCLNAGFAWLIKNTLLQLAGFLVWLTANMLNVAIQISILDFSKWAPDSLYPIWIVIRQIISLFVVFAGLYLGFMYIIGRTEAFGKYVGWLIIFALFVNFSYPFSRALIDVSNIISLNVYTASVGKEVLTGNTTDNNAGSLIMNKLGLQGLVLSATSVKDTGFVGSINSTPGALLAVAFVLYAAYIFFMATAIIAVRTAVLVFLTVASPLLLVDSVVPKLGDAAVKMRKMFFEQLAVAPVFMIMLALTLKFMDIFSSSGALSNTAQATSALALGSNSASGIQTFFSILMMLIMLHIMLKVTKSLSGEAGQAATNFMGKVGGFGLAAATMGTGVLARGTIGAGAARLRDSAWMDRLQGSAAGRGLYTLSNSLAQSTYDARNVGMVSKGMAKAGLTGGFGMSMQKASVRNFDDARAARSSEVEKRAMTIKDDTTRAAYLTNANKGRLVRLEDERLKETSKSIADKKQAQLAEMMTTTDPRKRETLINQAVLGNDYAMADKLRAGDAYHGIDNNNPQAAQQKADLLKKMGINDPATAKQMVEKDPFADLQKAHNEKMDQMKKDLAGMRRNTEEEKKAYKDAKDAIEKTQTEHEVNIANLKKATMDAFSAASQQQAPTQEPTRPAPTYSGPTPTQIPAVQRMNTANNPPRPANIPPSQGTARPTATQNTEKTPDVNEIKVETVAVGDVSTFNGVRNQSFAQHMEEIRRKRQQAAVQGFGTMSGNANQRTDEPVVA